MSLLDIIGPVMIGPSSSHTAGAVRIGMMARRLWGWERPLRSAKLFLRGSFAATYWGHGTDRGLVAGLLRMQPDDLRIPRSFEVARAEGLDFSFDTEEIDGAQLYRAVDGFPMVVPFGQPVLIVMHRDQPGIVSAITGEFYRLGLNVARMEMERRVRGGMAVFVFVLDGAVPADLGERIRTIVPACRRVILLKSAEEGVSA